MFQHLVVPVDGSAVSWDAVRVAAELGYAVDGKVDLVTVVDRLADVGRARRELDDGLVALGTLPIEPMTHVLASDEVAPAVAAHVDAFMGATVVMSSHGHGRSAAVLGSVADDLLRALYGPIVIVGPHVDMATAGRLDGNYIVPVDGSEASERILPVAGSWAIEFGAVPWIVEVVPPGTTSTGDVFESAYPARLASDLQRRTGHDVEFEVLHGDKPSRSIVDFMRRMDASLAFVSTHGRTGLDRIRLGSVAAEIVRHAPCPVVVYRPPHLAA